MVPLLLLSSLNTNTTNTVRDARHRVDEKKMSKRRPWLMAKRSGSRAAYEGCWGGRSDLRLGLREGRGDRSQVIAMQEPYVGRKIFQISVRVRTKPTDREAINSNARRNGTRNDNNNRASREVESKRARQLRGREREEDNG